MPSSSTTGVFAVSALRAHDAFVDLVSQAQVYEVLCDMVSHVVDQENSDRMVVLERACRFSMRQLSQVQRELQKERAANQQASERATLDARVAIDLLLEARDEFALVDQAVKGKLHVDASLVELRAQLDEAHRANEDVCSELAEERARTAKLEKQMEALLRVQQDLQEHQWFTETPTIPPPKTKIKTKTKCSNVSVSPSASELMVEKTPIEKQEEGVEEELQEEEQVDEFVSDVIDFENEASQTRSYLEDAKENYDGIEKLSSSLTSRTTSASIPISPSTCTVAPWSCHVCATANDILTVTCSQCEVPRQLDIHHTMTNAKRIDAELNYESTTHTDQTAGESANAPINSNNCCNNVPLLPIDSPKRPTTSPQLEPKRRASMSGLGEKLKSFRLSFQTSSSSTCSDSVSTGGGGGGGSGGRTTDTAGVGSGSTEADKNVSGSGSGVGGQSSPFLLNMLRRSTVPVAVETNAATPQIVLGLQKRAAKLEVQVSTLHETIEDLRARETSFGSTKQVLVDKLKDVERALSVAMEQRDQARAQAISDKEVIQFLDRRAHDVEVQAGVAQHEHRRLVVQAHRDAERSQAIEFELKKKIELLEEERKSEKAKYRSEKKLLIHEVKHLRHKLNEEEHNEKLSVTLATPA